jgi:transposase InsO family protein
MDRIIALRKGAIRRWLCGDSKASISRVLGKSPRWVRYWIERYDPDDPKGSLQNQSRAPKQPHQVWPEAVRQQAIRSRLLRMIGEVPGYEHALIGAEAIHYELHHLNVRPSPPPRTIHYWLKQAELIPQQRPSAVVEKTSKPYPLPVRDQVNDLHEVDLKGPFYLTGNSQKHYLVALRDFCSKGVALHTAQNKQARTVANFLVSAWQRRGLSKVLQMDNGLEFRGSNRYPRSFGKVIRLCLDLGVAPLFVPPHQPWRNGFIENFNGLFKRLLLDRCTLDSFEQLQAAVASLENAVNTTHRLAALNGQTPDEFIAGQSVDLLDLAYDGHKRDLQLLKGKISFIRLVRKSGRITICANDKFDIDPDLRWQYVLAQVDVQARQLNIYHQTELIKTFDYVMK